MKIIEVEPCYWSISHWGMYECTFWDFSARPLQWLIPPSALNDAAREWMASVGGLTFNLPDLRKR